MQEKVKTNIEVNGVVLTGEAISRLKELQEYNNDHINVIRNYIADTVCFLGQSFDYFSSADIEKVKRQITNLSYIRDYFNDLRKP